MRAGGGKDAVLGCQAAHLAIMVAHGKDDVGCIDGGEDIGNIALNRHNIACIGRTAGIVTAHQNTKGIPVEGLDLVHEVFHGGGCVGGLIVRTGDHQNTFARGLIGDSVNDGTDMGRCIRCKCSAGEHAEYHHCGKQQRQHPGCRFRDPEHKNPPF